MYYIQKPFGQISQTAISLPSARPKRRVYAELEKNSGGARAPQHRSSIRPCPEGGGGMSGGASLGLRSSGSYGSLQQSGCQSPTPSPPLAARKPAKMSLSGAGRGILCARICKLAGRRQRMLLLFLVTVAVAFCFLFSSLVNRGGRCLLPHAPFLIHVTVAVGN